MVVGPCKGCYEKIVLKLKLLTIKKKTKTDKIMCSWHETGEKSRIILCIKTFIDEPSV